MCFSAPPSPPKPPPLAPAPPPPPKPEPPAPAPQPLQRPGGMDQPTLRSKQSTREMQGTLSKGASQLKIPLNSGAPRGGLNL